MLPSLLRPTPSEGRWTGLLSAACLFVMSLTLNIASSSAAEHTQDSLATVQTRLGDDSAILVDVRELNEWEAGHLQQAILFSLSSIPDAIEKKTLGEHLPKEKIIYCHCRSGQRCLKAADLLQAAGYDVRPLKPGYQDLLDSGFKKGE